MPSGSQIRSSRVTAALGHQGPAHVAPAHRTLIGVQSRKARSAKEFQTGQVQTPELACAVQTLNVVGELVGVGGIELAVRGDTTVDGPHWAVKRAVWFSHGSDGIAALGLRSGEAEFGVEWQTSW